MGDDHEAELRHLLAQLGPPDVVRGELDADTVQRLDAMAGRDVEVTWPGEPVHDVDGALIGLGPPVTTRDGLVRPALTAEERHRLGVPEPAHDNEEDHT